MGHQHRAALTPLPGASLQRSAFCSRYIKADAVVSRQPIGVWLPLHARIVAVGSTAVHGKADIFKVPPARKAQWIRIADPRRTEIHLRDDSRNAIDWLDACFSHHRLRSLRQRPLLQCYAAADAMAQGDTVGIGGWIVTASSTARFSEQYHMAEVRSIWPALHDTAQKYIACFETLAQLALAMLAHSTCAARHWSFTLPAASDNAPTEAGLDKLWSTAEPLGTFLKLAASQEKRIPGQMHCPAMSLQCSHTAPHSAVAFPWRRLQTP